MAKGLPGDTFLAYEVYAETTWWGQLQPDARPNEGRESISVSATSRGGGCRWEFPVIQYELSGRPALRVALFHTAWAAFDEIPGFFAGLAAGKYSRLGEVTEWLDNLDAVDITDRPRLTASEDQDWEEPRPEGHVCSSACTHTRPFYGDYR